MNKTSKWIVALIIIGILVWVIKAANKSASPAAQGQVIKIGVVAPLTGGAAGYGLPLIKGIELAKKDLGSTTNIYEIVFEDDGTNPAQSASAAQKLVNVDKVSAVITTTSGTGNAVKPIATAAGIPHICICVDTTMTDNKTNFMYLALPEVEAEAWANEAASRGVKNIALIGQNHPGFNVIVDKIKPFFVEKGIKIAFEEKFDPTVKDFKTVIAKARASKPDLYFVGAFPPSLDVIGSELKTQGIKNVAGIGTFAISANPSLFDGDWFTDVNLTDAAFKERFVKEFPEVRFNARTAPEGYDAFNLLVKALESGQSPGSYIAGLTSYEGKVGRVTKPADKGNFSVSVGIWKIENGEAVQVK